MRSAGAQSGLAGTRPGVWRRAAAVACILAAAAVLGLSFAGYLRQDMVLDFAVLLQMCGLR